MTNLEEAPKSAAEALERGWTFLEVFPRPDQPAGIHNHISLHGYQAADLPFDQHGRPVPRGQYALWAKMGEDAVLANCGCVSHAEEGLLCPHDIALLLGK